MRIANAPQLRRHIRLDNMRPVPTFNMWSAARVVAADLTLRAAMTSDDATLLILAGCRIIHEMESGDSMPPPYLRQDPQQMRSGERARLIAECVVELAAALQRLAGAAVSETYVEAVPHTSLWRVVVEYDEAQAGLLALDRATKLVWQWACRNEGESRSAIKEVRDALDAARPSIPVRCLLRLAQERQIPARRLGETEIVELGTGRHLRRVFALSTHELSASALAIVREPSLRHHVLVGAGLPTPFEARVRSEAEAVAVACRLGFPLTLQAESQFDDHKEETRAADEHALRRAWNAIDDRNCDITLVRAGVGAEYALFLTSSGDYLASHLGEKSNACCDLSAAAKRLKGPGVPRRSRDRIIDGACTPPSADSLQVRTTDDPAAGEDPRADATDTEESMFHVHEANVAACAAAVTALGLSSAIFQVRSSDLGVPFTQNDACVLDIDIPCGASLARACDPKLTEKAALHVLKHDDRLNSLRSVPVIAVTGTNGKTTTARLIAHMLAQSGATVGLHTTDGIQVGARQIVAGNPATIWAARWLLANPQVDAVVLEAAHRGMLYHGVGVDALDAGAVLNVTRDHLGRDSLRTLSDLARLKATVVRAVKPSGVAVLNAADALVRAMAPLTRGRVILFAVAGKRARAHLRAHWRRGGIAVSIEGEEFVIRDGPRFYALASVMETPLAFGGSVMVACENILAAIAVGYGQGIELSSIRSALVTFQPSSTMNRGRMNFASARGVRVLIDYAHNAASLQSIVTFCLQLPASRRIAVIGLPADRLERDTAACGRLMAAFDHVIIRERDGSSANERGATARRIYDGARSGGMDDSRLEIVLSEREAVARALNLAAAGDLVVLFAHNVSAVQSQIEHEASLSL